MVYLHLRVLAALMVYTWRPRRREEVDFVVEHGRRLLAVEVKMRGDVKFRHTDGMRAFLDDHPDAAGGLVVHGGRKIERLTEKIVAVPWTVVAGLAEPDGYV